MVKPSQLSLYSQKYYFDDTAFTNLMKKRIYKVLLIASNYDAFILESDGRIEEQIFNEYASLNLRDAPQIIQVSTEEEAMVELMREHVDLVICMLNLEELDSIELARKVKQHSPRTPIVVLTPFSREISLKVSNEDLSIIDYIFSWLGNSDLLLAIIMLVEDKMNAEHDALEVGVQVILLVEDSVRFYSSYLPNIYKIVFQQSNAFMTEGLNEHQQMLRRRGRPKILLATNYEEAKHLYLKYQHNLLGIISDITYARHGVKDKESGLRFLKHVRKQDEFVPFLLQSSDSKYGDIARENNVGFLDKNSKALSFELRSYMMDFFAFGDFVFIDPDTKKEIMRAADLKALQQKIFEVPDKSLEYHIYRNHLSKWLFARALFPLAEYLKDIRPGDFTDIDEIRRLLFEAIAGFRLNKARGIIAEFNRESFDEYASFSRIGDGSIGGKARGLAFLDTIIKRNRLFDKFLESEISIPPTVVLCTDIFDEFMEANNLYQVALSDLPDEEIYQQFINARLPFRTHEDLSTLVAVSTRPIAVRSSSLLEDSHYQPFAGIYSTYMIPRLEDDRLMLEQLHVAIKGVYASVFFKDSKAYMAATHNVIDEEKMAIILQHVVGTHHNDKFFPTFSGVARSVNYYPIEPEKPEDGIASIAIGLGKYIMDGGITLRFSPKYPKKILQLSTPEMALSETQRYFDALNLQPNSFHPSVDDGVNIVRLKLEEAKVELAFKDMVSTLDYENNIIRPGVQEKGKLLVTFANILNYNTFPIAEMLDVCLKTSQQEIGRAVEIEFAVDLHRPKGTPKTLYLLQVRPIVENKEVLDTRLEDTDLSEAIIYSQEALGNGIIRDLHDLVYIKPDKFNPANNIWLAKKIGEMNELFLKNNRNYILIGPGRWGSNDPNLGIPIKWSQISAARVIVESGLQNYRVDPSQGTHFFQNLTSFRVGYLSINHFIDNGYFDIGYLDNCQAEYEDDMIRHIKFEDELLVKIDGRKKIGVIFKMKDSKNDVN